MVVWWYGCDVVWCGGSCVVDCSGVVMVVLCLYCCSVFVAL